MDDARRTVCTAILYPNGMIGEVPLTCFWRSRVWAVCEQHARKTKRMRWQVIHVPTGMAVSLNQIRKADALALAKELSRMCPRMQEKAAFGKVNQAAVERNWSYARVLRRHGINPVRSVA